MIQNSYTFYLRDWDAVATWLFKAKSLFLSDGIWSNQYFADTGLYDYSNKASYPIGIPLIVAAYYKLIGTINDQTVQFYFLQYFLNVILVTYAFAKQRLFSLSAFSTFLLTFSFFVTPLYLIYAHNGYVDIALSLPFLLCTIFFIKLFEKEFSRKIASQAFIIILLLGIFAANVKNEGLVFMGNIGVLSVAVFLHRYFKRGILKKLNISKAALYTFIIAVFAFPILLWRYFISTNHVVFYLDNAVFKISSLSNLKFILNHFLDVLMDTNIHSVTLIPILFLFIFQVTIFVYNKKWHLFLPSLPLLIQFCAYIYVYLVTTMPLNLQLQTSSERLLLQLLPSLFVIVAYQQSKISKYLPDMLGKMTRKV